MVRRGIVLRDPRIAGPGDKTLVALGANRYTLRE